MDTRALAKLLVEFSRFAIEDRSKFLNEINSYLAASSQARKNMVGEWERSVGRESIGEFAVARSGKSER